MKALTGIITAVFILFSFFSAKPSWGAMNGREIVVINGSNVFSFQAGEFDLTRSVSVPDSTAVHLFVEEYPVFKYPNGLRGFIEDKIVYPEQALLHRAEGVVLLNFIVEPDGSLSNPRLLRSVGHGCDEEVLRLFVDFPQARPGRISNKPVRVGMTVPVRFRLEY